MSKLELENSNWQSKKFIKLLKRKCEFKSIEFFENTMEFATPGFNKEFTSQKVNIKEWLKANKVFKIFKWSK